MLKRVDMAEYAGELAYAQSGAAAAKSFIYGTHAVTLNSAAPDAAQRSLATPRRYSRGLRSVLTASPTASPPGFRPVAKRHTSVFAYLTGLGLRLFASAAEARRREPRLRRGPASLGISASSRRLGGSRPAPVLRRLTGVPPQWWAEAFSGVKPAPLPGDRQRQEPPLASQADDVPTAAVPKPRFEYCFNPTDSTKGALM